MKKIIIGSLITGALILGGCSKNFLNVPATTPLPSNDPDAATDYVTAAYSSLIYIDAGGGWNYDTHGVAYIAATNIMSDDADKGSYVGDQEPMNELDLFTETSANSMVEALWSGHYAAIARTNNSLNALAIAKLDSATTKQYRGEILFLRGYYYFNLVRFFGGVPIVTYVPNGPRDAISDTTLVTRASADDIYNKVIIPDLQYAIDNCGAKGVVPTGRITKTAAETLLAKVYMYLRNWAKVKELTDDVINSGLYSLMPSYDSIWRQVGDNSSESIFEIQTGEFGGTDGGIPLYSEMQGPRNLSGTWNNPTFPDPTGDRGWGLCTPSLSLLNAYEPGDVRKEATIIILNPNSPTGIADTLWDGFQIPVGTQANLYNYKSYHSEKLESFYTNRDREIKNVHILRYAEVLLMSAEAATQLSGDVLTPLNMVRARAHLPAATTADQNAVWTERRVELGMEHDRFFDIVRQGRAAQVMQANGKAFKAGVNEILPIPGVEISLSGGRLTQNPGY